LRRIFVVGNRACAFTIFPITTILVILGKSVIEVWLGAKYVSQAYPVLMILIFPHTLMLMQQASPRVLFGMSKHGKLAIVTLIEGMANLVLSILLVRPYGIQGDALGTAIPMLGTFLFFMPWHLCSRLGVRMTTYLRQAYLLPLALCLPLATTLVLLRRWHVPHTYRQLIPQLLLGGLVYAIGIGWVYWSDRGLKTGDLGAAPGTIVLEPIPATAQEYSDEVKPDEDSNLVDTTQ
jgi:O-antigen/teichoic acid export membrane protein